MKADLATVLAEERRIMNLYAPAYDAAPLTNSFVYRIVRGRFVDWMEATLRRAGRDPASLTLLDAGSATGSLAAELARRGFGRQVGIELAEGMLAESRRRSVSGAGWVRGLIEEPPFRPESFDVIVACFTLHHLHDPAAFFRLAERTLRPDGWFFILEYNGDSGLADRRRGSLRRLFGQALRGLFAAKNRRRLAALPKLPVLQNSAHTTLDAAALRAAGADPARYRIEREVHGLLLPTLLPVLVEESPLDRAIARWAGAVDRHLEPRLGGLFQHVAGRRDPTA